MKEQDIEIRPSRIAGLGVFALREFLPGEIVIRWDLTKLVEAGQLDSVDPEELHFLCRYDESRFLINQPPARFVNHSCNPNVKSENLCDIALRKISPGEEITSNYNAALDGSAIEFRCNCKQPNCVGSVKKF
ncbi:MAG: SET domain-containing protein-lysine N-methyltransferase [Oligoflexia bacterium]|nr:SET domain-containing protein-lysine N-methyltransferase [Oligoflexia bacterium]